jgi:peptide/nickel transport system substrate-binding protein
VSVVPGLTIEHLELNESGALKDIRLRRALQYAINKVAYIRALFPELKNPTSILEHSVLPVVDAPWYNKQLPLSEYNPTKAKALLKAAGYATDYYGSGKHLTLTFATTPASTRVKELHILERYWAAVGVHVKEQLAPCAAGCKGGMFEPWNNNGVLYHGRYDVALFAYTGSPDPQQNEPNFDPKNIPGPSNTTGSNDSHIRDQDQFALLRSAGKTLDNAQRIAIFNKWQKLVNDRVYWIPLFNRPQISLSNGTIGNWKPHPGQQANEWNVYQWYKTSGYKASL